MGNLEDIHYSGFGTSVFGYINPYYIFYTYSYHFSILILFHTIPLLPRFSDGHHMAFFAATEVLSSTGFVSLQQVRPDKLKARREHRFWVICGMWICLKMGEIKIAKLFSKLLDSQKIDV